MQVVKIPLEAVGDLWALLHNVFSQFDPDAATGAALSGLVRLNGIERAEGKPSTVQLQLTGVAGTVIRKGQRVSDAQRPEHIDRGLPVAQGLTRVRIKTWLKHHRPSVSSFISACVSHTTWRWASLTR